MSKSWHRIAEFIYVDEQESKENLHMIFQINLADKVIQIDCLHDQVYYMCKNYLQEPMIETADINISISQNDIEYECQKAVKEDGAKQHSDAYLETLAVYRKIATALLAKDAWLMHGAVLGLGESAYMVTAKSGTGKTSVIRRALKNVEGSYVINGDKPLLRFSNGQVLACGTPWAGKEHMNRNCQAALKAIYILERGEKNEIEELSFSQAFPVLLQQTFKPADVTKMKRTLELLSQLGHSEVKCCRLSLKHYETVAELDNDEVKELVLQAFAVGSRNV